jgi:hypothetical protein
MNDTARNQDSSVADTFSERVMVNISPEIQDSFSAEQKTAISRAFNQYWDNESRSLPMRGIFHLFFLRLYYIIGVDTRQAPKGISVDRRGATVSKTKNVVFNVFVILSVISFVTVFLYALATLKSISSSMGFAP